MATLKNTNINDTGHLTVPVGTTAQRPDPPATGMIRWNTDTGGLENYDGTEWKPVTSLPINATGGTVTEIVDDGLQYSVHTFNSSGTFSVTSSGNLGGEVEYLIVAGGGGGGCDNSGGGGAGGLLTGTTTVTPQNYNIVVGSGGAGAQNAGGDSGPYAVNGTNSSALGLTAIGGGRGSSSGGANGSPGGSGGGGGQEAA